MLIDGRLRETVGAPLLPSGLLYLLILFLFLMKELLLKRTKLFGVKCAVAKLLYRRASLCMVVSLALVSVSYDCTLNNSSLFRALLAISSLVL